MGKPGSREEILARFGGEPAALAAVLECAPEGIVVADTAGRIILANRSAEELFGRTLPHGEPFESHAALRFLHPDGTPYDPRDLPLTRSALDGESRRGVELVVEQPDGRHRFLLANTAPLTSGRGEALGAVGVFQELTFYKTRESELRQAKEGAEAARRTGRAFLSRMSHEIRTPLHGMLGMIGMALEQSASPEQREHLELALGAGRHLLDVVNEILDFSSIEAGTVALAPAELDLRDVLKSTLAPLGALAERKGIRLVHRLGRRVPRRLVGDAGRLAQVVLNLADNAVKFTERGHVRVRVDLAEEPAPPPGKARLRFEVADTGIGIPAQRLSSLFERFHPGATLAPSGRPGTGLGLFIAKQLVELMGGEIAVESEPGAGSTFFFTAILDSAKRRARAAEPEPGRGVAARPPPLRILLAEDDRLATAYARTLLERQGHTVVAVTDGRSAVDTASRETFDLVLMDVEMPGMDGLEATRLIREGGARDCPADIPILGFTAHAYAEDRERFLAAGMDGCLAKPFTPEELAAAVGSLVPAVDVALPAPCDLDRILKETAGDRAFLASLVRTFAEDYPGHLDRLARAVGAGETHVVSRQAHAFRGVLNILRAPAATELARQLEEMGRQEDLTGAAETLGALEEETSRLLQFLTEAVRGEADL